MPKLLFLLPLVVWGWLLSGVGQAMEAEANPRDILVYKDGDRVQGQLVEKTDRLIVFQSDRFGELQVPADKAVVILAGTSKENTASLTGAGKAAPTAERLGPSMKSPEKAAPNELDSISGWEWFSPAVLTARLRAFFGPWQGRLAVSTEVVADTADRSNLSLETQLKRKGRTNEVQLKARYDYSETNQLTSTDMIRADAQWRHEFSKKSFALYRPSVEWNRASFTKGVPSDYVLLQQEIGAGFNLLATPARKLRVGVSENLFDVWSTAPVDGHDARTVESAFVETELRVPWGMLLTERGVYYYSLTTRDEGWENRIELTKKFTETLSTAIRHELREGSPDRKAKDYTRLKLLFGLDF